MMHWSDFKKKIKEQSDENKTVDELEKGQKVSYLYILVFFALFFIASTTSMCAFSVIDGNVGVVLVAVYSGFLMILFTILMVQQSLYIFMRKQFNMREKESFEDDE